MKASVEIQSNGKSKHDCAPVSICIDGSEVSQLYCDFTKLLKAVRHPTDVSLDFLLVAATVYSLDKLAERSKSRNGWEREFTVSIPVKNSALWTKAKRKIDDCLSFLSGDNWNITFSERTRGIVHKNASLKKTIKKREFLKADEVCLFSGGLDSLIGAIDTLHRNGDHRLALVGHHDPNIGGVEKDQKQLLEQLDLAYPNRCHPVFVGVGHSGKGQEITMRSRSLLFIGLGLVVADHLGEGTKLLIPENGTIALNVPLTASRRGSCSTRTAHPHYLALLQDWLNAVGLRHPVENPLLEKTKGEAVKFCLNQALLRSLVTKSTSCAKPGHTVWWVRRNANGCGQCMPCIFRRAALNTAGLDAEIYGNDICTGEVDVFDPDTDAADDFRAVLSFLKSKHSEQDIAKLLVSSCPLPPTTVMDHANTVYRAMDEVRALLRQKANKKIQRAAGI